ncbi:hypothetical protein N474_24095 [Pseudoalteromonas luteoviolacea CPMOR-2]|uniref:Uncharacterized protein n=2 Tax=Pseudoalteromonas luteoviolacea TaxID=43657 RepID=A0A166W894_9GAMM|nr:hypothetical protein N475_17560 [Pseudoalteromonas luteoviolacea DSM 6061]KZN51527.1 hypothetical protein N474_24095 [Pseudoalteromonas luteoviolacea CPMOR-2]MBE0386647.1 hypothetical protein [Pseudoalteromonas luteoviolacea DSM 6061]
MVIENNRQKARDAEKRIFNERVKDITSLYKRKISEYVDCKLIRPKHAPKFNAIVGNFFVVQPHNDENLDRLEKVSELLLMQIGSELNKCRNNDSLDLLSEQLFLFAAELPSAGIAYNKTFYTEVLPALISRIQTPDSFESNDSSQNPDTQEGDEIEKEEQQLTQNDPPLQRHTADVAN